MSYIASVTSRDYVKLRDVMSFISASTSVKDLENTQFVEFGGSVFLRKGKPDESVVTLKRNIIVKYRDILKKERGFSG